MGLARELTLGPNGGKRRRSPQPGSSPDYAALRRLTASPAPDVEAFRAVMLRVGSSPSRMRVPEVRIFTAASERFHELTGEWLGPSSASKPEPAAALALGEHCGAGPEYDEAHDEHAAVNGDCPWCGGSVARP